MLKKIIFFFSLIILMACNNPSDKEFESFLGRWQITEFYIKEKDSIKEIDYVLLGFEKNKQMWFTKLKDGKDFTFCDYKISKEKDSLKIDLINCQDKRFNGNYNLYIDTIQNKKEYYILRMIFDSENAYIQAIKQKLKYSAPLK